MLKITKHAFILAIILQSTMAFSFDLTEEGINKAIEKYLSFQMDNIDESAVNELTQLVRDNLDVFSYIAKAQTDPTVLPYLEKYNALKMRYTGQPINSDVKVILSNNPLKNPPHDMSGVLAGWCDYFTRTVFLDRDFWNFHKDNEKMREALLFHELGHCDLSRRHGSRMDWGRDERKPYFSFMSDAHLLEPLLLIPNFFELMASGSLEQYSGDYERGYKRCSKKIVEEYMRGGEHPFDCEPELEFYHYEYVLNSDLDRAFEALNKELFSIQNTHNGVLTGEICTGGKCTKIYEYQSFEPLSLPIIKHLTIGPAIAPTAQDFYEDYYEKGKDIILY